MSELKDFLDGAIERLTYQAIKACIKKPSAILYFTRYKGYIKEASYKRADFIHKNIHIPPFLIASITSNCNLFCKGCYSRNLTCSSGKELVSTIRWKDIFHEAREIGVCFILLAGGEPLMRKDVIEETVNFPEIIFPVFTNGTLIDDEYISLFTKARNILPIISLEGDKIATDDRRGDGVYSLVLQSMSKLKKQGIFFGTSITVTKENLLKVTDACFIDMLKKHGCCIIFYVEYVPADELSYNLELSDDDRVILEGKIHNLKNSFSSLLFISFPGDEKYTGGCLAAGRGFFHINAYGGAEPCPFSPYSDVNIKENSLIDAINSKLFQKLKQDNILNNEHKGGCSLFAQKAEVEKRLIL